MNKKSVSIAINTIIAATIALVVLFVLIAVFTGRINIFSQSIETCYSKGGTCLDEEGSCPGEAVTVYTKDCDFYPKSEQNEEKLGQCCVPIK
ncbi:hypothetical protein GF323_01260 [Candidatus Woesearchaeota archaeon]|nr:hypothetical protein [Candidatus Woesearchaeota archaeon]